MNMRTGLLARTFLKLLQVCICGQSVQFLMKPLKMVSLKKKNVIHLEDVSIRYLIQKIQRRRLNVKQKSIRKGRAF